jgi:hypothetical protein
MGEIHDLATHRTRRASDGNRSLQLWISRMITTVDPADDDIRAMTVNLKFFGTSRGECATLPHGSQRRGEGLHPQSAARLISPPSL